VSAETYYVTVKSTPEINAKIFINGNDTGKTTPCTFTLVKGVYTFRVGDPSGKYNFVEWWKDDTFLSRDPEVTVEVEEDLTLDARFIPYTPKTTAGVEWSGLIQAVLLMLFVMVLLEVIKIARIRG